jgi:very-short-patch-repair endonuclease
MNPPKDVVIEAKKRCRELRKRQTPAETSFWELVRDCKFHGLKFYRQHPLFFELNGRTRFFITDFFCHECRLAIQLDGPIHNKQEEQDKYREHIVMHMGICILRFANDEVLHNPERVLSELEKRIGQEVHPCPPFSSQEKGGGG